MQDLRTQHPDISDIVAQKDAGRRQRAALTFAEKLVLLEALKERVRPIAQARIIRNQQSNQSKLQRV